MAALALLLPPAEPAQTNLPTAAEIDAVLKELGEITGFQVRRQLPFQAITREEINRYLQNEVRRSVKPEEIRAEETTLKKFGLVPLNFDLRSNTIDLLTEQAAAFYDFHRRKLYISDWASQNMRETALVHELAHALADQTFPIRKFLGRDDDSEQSLARQTVVEGQASWLMIEYAARRGGRSLKDEATAAELLKVQPQDAAEDEAYPVFSKAPLYIRRTLMFPYEEGEKFQQTVFLKEGKGGFRRLFEEPPVSTAQILHPDRYFAKVTATNPTLPKALKGMREFVSGAMGELDESVLLEQYAGAQEAAAVAPHLKGATYRIDEGRADKRDTLVYASEWDDEASAARYFGDYVRILKAKWKSVETTREDAGEFSGKSEDGYFRVIRDGVRVRSWEGFAAAPTPIQNTSARPE